MDSKLTQNHGPGFPLAIIEAEDASSKAAWRTLELVEEDKFHCCVI